MLVLRTLQWGPQHGHGIGQAIRSQSDDLLKVETGSLYPALHRLVKRGWLKSEWGVSEANQRAKYYQLTADRQGAAARASRIAGRSWWTRSAAIMNPAPPGKEIAHAARRSRARRRDPRPPGDQHQGAHRARRGSGSRAPRRAAGVRLRAGHPRLDAPGLVQPLVRRGRGARARHAASALRSLLRAKGLAATVVVTLALGIGANAAIFSVVRGVLLRPLVNRDEDRLIYIRQSAPGLGAENMTFSVPEINDLKSRVTTISAFGDFSTVDFTMIGLGGEPRIVKAGVVGGSFFEVMGLRPVLGRLLDAQDEGPRPRASAVLTHRFWSTSLNSDPAVIGKTIRLGPRTATVVGVLEPSVPYPADTEIIANVVTSPHHLGATMVTDRTHRMTELFGRLAPGATIEKARAELTAAHAAMVREHPAAYSPKANIAAEGVAGSAIRSPRRRGRSCSCCSPRPAWSSSLRARTSRT